MKTIFKYILKLVDGPQEVRTFFNSKVILVGEQGGSPIIWMEVDNTADITMTFYVVGTGHPIPKNSFHVGSYLSPPFVWHIYESLEEKIEGT